MTTHFTDINAISVRYSVDGPRSLAHHPCVFLHEIGGSLESWEEVVGCLPDQACLRYDLRGFGQSEKPRGPLRLREMIGDLAGLLDHVGVERAVLVGCAVGAGIALAAAPSLGRRVAGIIACAPATGVAADRKAGLRALADRLERDGVRDFVVGDTVPGAWPETIAREPHRFERFRGLQLAADPAMIAGMFRMLTEMTTEHLGRIACPVLLVAGRHDVIRTPAMIQALAQQMIDARCVVIDSGHFMAQQNPELVADLIRSSRVAWSLNR